MKRTTGFIAAAAALLSVASAHAQAPTARQIATQRWFDIRKGVTVKTAAYPAGMVFDGESIWVATASSLQKIQPGRGAVLMNVFLGFQANAIAFDGANIWLAGLFGGQITKVQASDGSMPVKNAPLGTCSWPNAMVFDGQSVWVACQNDSKVYRMPLSGPANATSFAAVSPQSLAFDGSNIWVGNGNNTIERIDAAGNVFPNVLTMPGLSTTALAFDGSNLWAAVYTTGSVYKIPLAPLAQGQPLAIALSVPVGGWVRSLTYDGLNIWTANYDIQSSSKISFAGGALTVKTTPLNAYATGTVFDGSDVWVSLSSGVLAKM